MQASTWKKKNFCSMYLPQFYLKPFFDPGERKKKQETFRQIGCVEKKRRKLCQFETALPKLYTPSTINTDYLSGVHVLLVSLFGRPIVWSISHFFGRPILFLVDQKPISNFFGRPIFFLVNQKPFSHVFGRPIFFLVDQIYF